MQFTMTRSSVRNIAVAFVLVAATLAGVGCSNTSKKEVYQHWNSARAGVQGSLAAERYKTGNLDDARKACNEAMNLDPENPTYHILSARIYIEKNQLESADQELAIVRKLAPKLGEADYLSGIIYQRWQKPQLALDYYSQACEKSPGELQFLMARAEMMVQVGKIDEAVTLIESKLTYFEYSGPLRDLLGGLYMQQGKISQAVETLHQASILSTDDLIIREHLMRAYFKAKDYNDCVVQLEMLLKSPDMQKRGDLYMLKGECQLQLLQHRDALLSLDKALELNPSSVPALLAYAKVCFTVNDLANAQVAAVKAATLDPNEPQAHIAVGYLRMRQERWADALDSFTRAAQLAPKDPVAVCLIGMVYDKLGKHDAAMAQYTKALELNPENMMAKALAAKPAK